LVFGPRLFQNIRIQFTERAPERFRNTFSRISPFSLSHCIYIGGVLFFCERREERSGERRDRDKRRRGDWRRQDRKRRERKVKILTLKRNLSLQPSQLHN
jgi:hypothetical protein